MFSEENIKRTKERLVGYVEDNKDSFTRKGDVSLNNYWSFTTEELSVKPIEDAINLLGSATTIDIIVETLNDIHGVSGGASYQAVKPEETTEFTTDEDDEYEVFRSVDNPFLLYEWFNPNDVKSDKETMKSIVESEDENEDEDYYDDYDEDDYGYDGDYNGFYDEDDEGEDDIENALYEWFKQIDIKSNDVTEPIVGFEDEKEDVSDKEMVNHPPHYNQGKFETIDIIEDIVAGYDDPVEAYLVGTTLKYLARAPFKNAKKQDLEKAEFYLKRAIDRQQ